MYIIGMGKKDKKEVKKVSRQLDGEITGGKPGKGFNR